MLRTLTSAFLWTALAVTSIDSVPPARSQSGPKEKSLYVKLLHSSTWVVAVKPSPPGTITWEEGSGWVVSARRKLVMTNFHVVGKKKEAQVIFPYYVNGQALTARKPYVKLIADGGGSHARVLAVDQERDLALLQLERMPSWVKPLPLAARGVSAGERVYNLGNPGGDESLWQFSSSKVLKIAKRKLQSKFADRDLLVHARIIETDDARARRGQSGSALVNPKGELVGMIQSTSQAQPQTTMCIDRAEILAFLEAQGVKAVMADDKKLERK